MQGSGNVQDISSLQGLEQLRELNLRSTTVRDVEPLRRLWRTLVGLTLPDELPDLSPVSDLVNLQFLQAAADTSEQVVFLSSLTALRKLVLGPSWRRGDTLDVSALASMQRLEELHLVDVYSASLQSLNHLPLKQLTVLRLRDGEDLGGMLPRMSTTLRKLDLEDLSGIVNLSQLSELQELRELRLVCAHNVQPTLEPLGQL